MMQSKYPTANEDKINLGPVISVNPRYVRAVQITGTTSGGDASSWITVFGHGVEWTSELESLAWCEETALEFLRRNPKIEFTRDVYEVEQA